MRKYRRSALVISISFIILFSISLFLYSCGVSSPTGSSPGGPSTQQTTTPATQPAILLSASSTGINNITINLTTVPGKTYHLYMTDNPNAQASTSTPLPDNNIHNLTLDTTKTYYFILGEVGSDGKEHFSGAYITSKPPIGNNARENIVINPHTNDTETKQIGGKDKAITNNNSGINGLFGLNPYLKLTGGSRINVWYDDMATGSAYGNLHISEPSGGHFVRRLNGSNLLGGHPEVKKCVDWQGNTVEGCYTWVYRWWQSSSPVAGYWDYDEDRYANNHANGTFDISLIYTAYPEPFHSFYGKPYFIYKIKICGENVADGVMPLQAGANNIWGAGTDYITPPISITAPGLCPDNTQPPPQNKKLAKIEITPKDLTTIYIHPKKPDPGKPDHGSQQYTAMGTFEGETIPVDVTKTGDVIWHSSKPDIATMSTKAGEEGLFVPVTTPKITLGTTDIQATSKVPAAPADIQSNIAHLNVACWEVTHIRQNNHVPNTEIPNWRNEPYGMDWGIATMTNQKGKPLASVYFGTRRLTPGAYNSLLDAPEYSIGAKGCHMVCANMVITVATQKFSNPKIFNDWLADPAIMGFTPPPPQNANGIIWGVINNAYSSYISATGEIDIEQAPKKDNAGNITNPGYTAADSYAKIDAALDKCNMVILRVNGIKGFHGHYVLIASGRGGNYKIYDPWQKYYGNPPDPDTRIDDLSLRYQLLPLNYNIITLK